MLTKIYDNSPVFVQNMMVSAYGAKLFYERYFRRDKEFMNKLMESQWFSRDQLISLQRDKLRELLRHAAYSVPYYRKIFADLSLNLDDINRLEDLGKLPFLQKETLRTRARDLVSTTIPTGSLVPLNTSGTTGKSLRVYVDLPSRRKCYCFTSRFHQWVGLPDSRHNITLGGRTIVPHAQGRNVFWRYNAAMDNYLFSIYHMANSNLPFFYEKIRKFRPRFIEAYPSAAYLLSQFILSKGLEPAQPLAVITSGETLFENQRDIIERAFGCPVFDQYGCTEQAHFVSQCEYGTYHVHPEFGLIELVDDQGRPVAPGRIGRVVCTSFMNRAMPLIRYDLGDMATWGGEPCRCGRNFPVLQKIYGRADDMIKTPSGRLVGRLASVFRGMDCIKLAQIIQIRLNKIVVKIVPGDNFSSKIFNSIRMEMAKRLGEEMEIEFKLVEDIEKSKTGKFKVIISEI